MFSAFTLLLLLWGGCLALGWISTTHVTYRLDPASPFASLGPALVAMDRALLGQIAVLAAVVRKLIYARELLVGLAGLHTEGEGADLSAGAPTPTPAATPRTPATPASFAWVRRGLGMLDTARRVQARMAGHVAREIAGEAMRERERAAATAAAQPPSGLAGPKGRVPQEPLAPRQLLQGLVSAAQPNPLPRTFMPSAAPHAAAAAAAPAATLAPVPVVRIDTAPWESDDEGDVAQAREVNEAEVGATQAEVNEAEVGATQGEVNEAEAAPGVAAAEARVGGGPVLGDLFAEVAGSE
jgi:hypothetical protein